MRAGLHVSGAVGSGVLIARLPDGSWSPPSGILVQALGVGFNMGIDIYDCVVVINNRSALQAFSKLRVTLGAQVSAAVGPLGVGGSLDANVDPRKTDPKGAAIDRSPCYTYMKSRGLYAGVQIDGTFIIARNDENTRFYGERLPVSDILAGRLQNHVPAGVLPLMEVAKAAEGRWNLDHGVPNEVSNRTAPEDGVVEKDMEASEKESEAFQRSEEEESRRSAKEREAYGHDIPHEATQ
jgi:lipid-binding SYLF domain-containing protein